MINLYEKFTWTAYALSKPFLELWSGLEGKNGMWSGRLGHLPRCVAVAGPQDIWLQAVSVGEVALAETLVQAIDRRAPELKILISVTTPTGFARAMSSLGSRCSIIPYPLDFPQTVRKIANEVRPGVYACLETELWPNLISTVRQLGSKTVLLNGRISAKSFPRYLRLFSITRPLLVGFSKICAISDIHADRLIALGAPVDSIQVTGNAKFEGLLYKPNLDRVRGFRNRLKIDDSTKVLVAGSLRRGEEREIINAYDILRSQWSDMVCFLVPRHLKMVSSIVNALKKKSMPYQLWSDLEINQQRTEKVIVVDVIGPLFDLYGLATAAFVGGSLIPKGGQNLLEPAAWSCPVVYGPHTDNFEEAKMALESSGGGQCVNSGRELAEVVNLLFVEPLRRREKGKKSRKTLEDLAKGVATKQTDILLEVLESKNRSG